MRVAVIGSGISGMLAARLLATRHLVDVYEAGDHVGGHAHSVDVDLSQGNFEGAKRQVAADVAFMVLNRRTYPNFCQMLSALGVDTQASDMSLSVRSFATGLEYQGSSLNGIFAQRRNLLRPSFYGMLRDIAKFNRLALEYCEHPDDDLLLGEFLDGERLGSVFREHYLIPMSAAIWSSDPSCLTSFPAKFILGFLKNHGLLHLSNRPQWLTIAGRSQRYVAALTRPFADRIHVRTPVHEVRANGQGFAVKFKHSDKTLHATTSPAAYDQPASSNETVQYDHVVFATHADQTMRILADMTETEQEVLSGFPYQANDAVLHTDVTVLPKRKRAWASWNYHLPAEHTERVSVTYDLNRLQSLGLEHPLCLTLNPNCDIDASKILRRFEFQHPVFSEAATRSQERFAEINDRRGISYCGAYWGYGFHEDGVKSALAVATPFGLGLDQLNDPMFHSQRQAVPERQTTSGF